MLQDPLQVVSSRTAYFNKIDIVRGLKKDICVFNEKASHPMLMWSGGRNSDPPGRFKRFAILVIIFLRWEAIRCGLMQRA